jgi:hypothetical protein
MNDPAASSPLTMLRKFVWNSLLRVPWLIAYNVGGAAVLVLFFALSSQGKDMLRISAERGFALDDLGLLWNLLFLLSTLLVSFSFWYSSRLLLGRDYKGYPLERRYAAFGRRWWPRLAGTAVPAAVGWTFLGQGSGAERIDALLGWLYLGMAALLLLFYLLRRWVFGIDRNYRIKELDDEIPLAERQRLRTAILLSLLLVVLLVLLPVHLPQWLGAPALAVLGIGGISLFGSGVLTYLPMAKGAPAATLTALLLALVLGVWNDNHRIRVERAMQPENDRPTPAERFAAWQRSRPVAPDGTAGTAPAPVFIAAAGGGIRAAYWTASTLAYLEERFGDVFTDRLFAISGVSGGSLGAAVYVTLKRAGLDGGDSGGLLEPARGVLGQDFLSPVVAGMLFPDLVQRFFPIPVPAADRQRFLERSWELAFDGATRELFRGPFPDLYRGENAIRLPSLLLNTTVVETGQRGIVSNLQVDDLPGVLDLLDPRYGLTGIRTSAAAGASARFTYVSPAGTVRVTDGGRLRLVDGGYFESSGAASTADLIAALRDGGVAMRPILLLIRNDPVAPDLCRRDGGGTAPPAGDTFNSTVSEVGAPIEALLETRSARGHLAEVQAARLVEGLGGTVIEWPLAAVLRSRLTAVAATEAAREAVRARYLEPPLGWSLSDEVRRGMDETLDQQAGGLARELRYLAAALGEEAGSVPSCEPQ